MTQPIIVCVDDDIEVVSAVVRTLRREQLQTMPTTEPDEALAWVLEHDVAVLVSDYSMPGMNGVELAERVREQRPLTVRILLTGNQEMSTMLAGINRAEVYRYVTKPFDATVLLVAVREGVARYRELVAIAAEREKAQLRARLIAELETKHPGLTTPARAHDGAYLVQRHDVNATAGVGLEGLLALRGSR